MGCKTVTPAAPTGELAHGAEKRVLCAFWLGDWSLVCLQPGTKAENLDGCGRFEGEGGVPVVMHVRGS